MGRKKKRLSGAEIYCIVMDDGAVCNNCEVEMDYLTENGDGFWYCPNCKSKVHTYDYEYMWENDEAYDLYMGRGDDDDYIPAGCAACGGPYPKCKTSCRLFDD